MLRIWTKCLIISEPRWIYTSSFMEANFLMQMDNGVSKKEQSKTRQYFLPSLCVKLCEVRHESGKSTLSSMGALLYICCTLLCSFFLNLSQFFRERSVITTGIGFLTLICCCVAFLMCTGCGGVGPTSVSLAALVKCNLLKNEGFLLGLCKRQCNFLLVTKKSTTRAHS